MTSTQVEEVQKLLTVVIRAIVDAPDDVKVSIFEGERTTVFRVEVTDDDIGKVIGKKGVMAETLRHLVFAIGSKIGRRMVIELKDRPGYAVNRAG